MSQTPDKVDVPQRSFEKVILFGSSAEQNDVGTLTAYSDRLEFDGKKFMVTFSNIRGVAYEMKQWDDGLQRLPRVRVTHGTGEDVSISYIAKSIMGLPRKVREGNLLFNEELRDIYGEVALSGNENQQMPVVDEALRATKSPLSKTERKRLAVMDESLREAKLRRARSSIWIGLVLTLGGILLTIITYSSATSGRGGGTYIVAYGPVLVGLGILINGLIGFARYRQPPPPS